MSAKSRFTRLPCINDRGKYGDELIGHLSKEGFEMKRSSQKTIRALIVAPLFFINLTVPYSASAHVIDQLAQKK